MGAWYPFMVGNANANGLGWLSTFNGVTDPKPVVEAITRLSLELQDAVLTGIRLRSQFFWTVLAANIDYIGHLMLAELMTGWGIVVITALFFYKLWGMRGVPPGPWGLPIVGYLPWIDMTEPYKTFMELADSFGPIYSLSMGSVFTVVLTSPSIVREALSKDVLTGRAPLYLTHGIMNNCGLVAAQGERWKEQRKFVINCLKNLGAVKVGHKRDSMESRILKGVRETVKMLDDNNGESLDPREVLLHTMGNVVNSIVFGKTYPQNDPEWEYLQQLAEEGVKLIGVTGAVNFLPFLRHLPENAKSIKYITEGKKKTHDLYTDIINENRDGEDILSYYREAMRKRQGRYFCREQLLHVLADMFGAGVDTTLSTLRWYLLLVALHPDVQSRVQDELDLVLGKREDPKVEDLPSCPFTEASIYEVMRLRPVVPLGIPHGALDDTELGGFRIPRGTMVLINQWALHHDPVAWRNPNLFTPERFLGPSGKIRKPDHFNPFQNGKRVCIGEEMTRMMLFLFVGGLLKRYKVSCEEGCQEAMAGVCGITLTPGYHSLSFTRRHTRRRSSTKSPDLYDQ